MPEEPKPARRPFKTSLQESRCLEWKAYLKSRILPQDREQKSGAHHAQGILNTEGKVEKVMHEAKHGDLKSGSGKKVTSHKQAVAIAMHEAHIPKKRH